MPAPTQQFPSKQGHGGKSHQNRSVIQGFLVQGLALFKESGSGPTNSAPQDIWAR